MKRSSDLRLFRTESAAKLRYEIRRTEALFNLQNPVLKVAAGYRASAAEHTASVITAKLSLVLVPSQRERRVKLILASHRRIFRRRKIFDLDVGGFSGDRFIYAAAHLVCTETVGVPRVQSLGRRQGTQP